MEQVFAHFSLSGGLGFSVGIAFASITILLFGEIIPKNIAQAHSERLFMSTLWFTNTIFYLMEPIAKVLSTVSGYFIYKIRGSHHGENSNSIVTEKEIRFLIDYINEKGMIDPDKTEMLRSIFDLGRTTVREIMVPQIDVISVNITTSVNKTLELFCKYSFSRLPIYEKQTDNIIGMVHQKDIFLLLSRNENKPLRELVRQILFVPETMKVNQLLRQLRQQRRHIAMVINEYGGIIGLVTLEDALEEIVGDINDEHESVTEHIIQLEQGGWLVYAGVELEKLTEQLGISFQTEDAITLGGFLTEQLQHVPKKGERLSYQGHCFQIQKSTPKRIVQVLVFKEKNIDS